MNKRLKKKRCGNKNKATIEGILSVLSENFSIKTCSFGDGYFIFEMGPNSVCHFTIKETPGWKYGIWYDEKECSLFGEHCDLIDKFKPSRTYLSCTDVAEYVEAISDIVIRPKYHFVNSLTFGGAEVGCREVVDDGGNVYYEGYQVENLFNESTGLYAKQVVHENITMDEYVEREYCSYMKEKESSVENVEFDRKLVFDFFKKGLFNISNHIGVVGVKDNNADGWESSPRYSLSIILEDGLLDEEYEELYSLIDVAVDITNYSSGKKTSAHQITLDGVYTSKNLSCLDKDFTKKVHFIFKKEKDIG